MKEKDFKDTLVSLPYYSNVMPVVLLHKSVWEHEYLLDVLNTIGIIPEKHYSKEDLLNLLPKGIHYLMDNIISCYTEAVTMTVCLRLESGAICLNDIEKYVSTFHYPRLIV